MALYGIALAQPVSAFVAAAVLLVPVVVAVLAIVLLIRKVRRQKKCDELDIAHKHGMAQAYGLDRSTRQHNGPSI